MSGWFVGICIVLGFVFFAPLIFFSYTEFFLVPLVSWLMGDGWRRD